jgi:two-component system, cell cycle sensor histidine kinase and response regulator CckA
MLLSARLQEVTEFVFDMEHATTLGSGIEIAIEDHIDAIILDLSLPDSVGLVSYHKLRTLVKDNVPIIIITGSDDRELVSDAMQQGADNYLVKDNVDGNRIAIAILSAIRNRTVKADSGAQKLLDTQ